MKILYLLNCILILFFSVFSTTKISYAQSLDENIVNSKIEASQMTYLAAWASTGAYNDELSVLARDILSKNGWQINHYSKNNYSSDVKFLLAEKDFTDQHLYFLAICGTESLQDIKTDLSVKRYLFAGTTPSEFEYNMQTNIESLDENMPLVHSGFLQYVQDGFFTKKSDSDNLTFGEKLLSNLQENKKAKLYITGHSLGGAVAELLAARLIDMGADKNQIRVISFGAPAVGNQVFVNHYESELNLTRITMSGDPVKNLTQIANTNLVQFKTNTIWNMPKYENDKSTHAVLLYFDRAMHNYYENTNPSLENIIKKANNPHTYVEINFNFPVELQSEKFYIDTAIKENLLYNDANGYTFSTTDKSDTFANAKKIGANTVIIYNFEAVKLQNNTSPKRYYIHGSKFTYDYNGNLLNGSASSIDTNTMTVLQAALYTIEKSSNN